MFDARGRRGGERWAGRGTRAARHTPAVGGTTDNGAVPTYRDEAIVLRTQKLGESDRIITLLTRRLG